MRSRRRLLAWFSRRGRLDSSAGTSAALGGHGITLVDDRSLAGDPGFVQTESRGPLKVLDALAFERADAFTVDEHFKLAGIVAGRDRVLCADSPAAFSSTRCTGSNVLRGCGR